MHPALKHILFKGVGVLRPPNLVVASIGDSLEAQSVSTTVGSFVSMDYRGCHPWSRALVGQRYFHPGAASKGVGGNTLTQILARITDVTAMSIAGPDGMLVRPGTVILEGGANSVSQGHSLAQMISDLEGCITACRAAGQNVVIVNVTPQNSTSTFDAAQLARLADFRDYVRARPRPSVGVLVADAWDDIAGTPNGTYALATMLRDTVHWHPKAAYLVGLRLSQQMARLFPLARSLSGANLVTGGAAMTGTAGAKANGVTGEVATGWSATANVTLSGDQTIVASKVDLGDGNFGQRFTINGTYGVANGVSISQTLSGFGTTYLAGDTMSFEGRILLPEILPAPTSRFTPNVGYIYKSGGEVRDALLGADEPTPSAALDITPRIERFITPGDSTRVTPSMTLGIPAGTYTGFVVDFRSPVLVKH